MPGLDAESYVNERKQRIFLICIRFGLCNKAQRLNLASDSYTIANFESISK